MGNHSSSYVGVSYEIDNLSINVKWPVDMCCADPNELYRPWLELHVGQQAIDWNWELADSDAANNRLTITFSKGKEKWATLAALMWA